MSNDPKQKDVIAQLERLNVTAGKILDTLARPPNKAVSALQILAAGVGALGILGIADLVIKWLSGGR
jgi:hypothetical protein